MQQTLFHVLHSVNSFSANRQYLEKFHAVYPNLAELIGNYTHIPRHKLPIARQYLTALVIRAESVGIISDDPFPMNRFCNRLLSEGFWSHIHLEHISKYAFSYVVIWLGKLPGLTCFWGGGWVFYIFMLLFGLVFFSRKSQ